VIITLPSTSLEDKIRRRNNAINAVVDYYNIKEGRAYRPSYRQRQSRTGVALSQVKIKEDAKILEAAKALESIKLSLYKEKRLKIYFVCLRNKKLVISKRIYRFYTPTTLIKYFQQAYLSKLLRQGKIKCNVYKVPLKYKMYF
jgi:hypothetical protein